jgi:hypothetical protein
MGITWLFDRIWLEIRDLALLLSFVFLLIYFANFLSTAPVQECAGNEMREVEVDADPYLETDPYADAEMEAYDDHEE